MKNNLLDWFYNTFNDGWDEDGSHKVITSDSYFMYDLEKEMLEARKKDIKNILKILNDNFPISDGGPCWLETEEDYENVTNQIIEFEKNYINYGKPKIDSK